jgi:Family of unknown function (DUF6188)
METATDPEVWDLPIVGYEVVTVEFSGRIGVVAYGTRSEDESYAPSAGLYFGGGFLLHDQHGVLHSLDAESPWESLTPLLALRHRTVVLATADSRSHIEIQYDDGSKLIAGPQPPYENWELVGPRGLNLVAMPSGGDPRILGDLG